MPKSRAAAQFAVEVSQAGLRFNEPLSWRVGKAIPIGDLLRRLQALAKELKDIDQDETDRDALTAPAKELAGQNLLGHKDRGVRAWTACCLADILRLCAPEAPFTASQLKDIFTLFVRSILPSLADPLDPYNGQHLYVLQSLSQVKSIILLTDVPSSNDLIEYLFTSCFDMLSTSKEELSKNVEYNMTGLLECMVDECQGLPPRAVEIILAQFLRADPRISHIGNNRNKKAASLAVDSTQATLQVKQLTPAYNMAKNLCNACVDRMSRYVSQYFSNVIMDMSLSDKRQRSKHETKTGRFSNDLDGGEHAELDQQNLHELEKAHRLLRELWKCAPGVVQNVIPQVEAELSAENFQLRMLAAEAIGDMISGIGAAGPPAAPVMDPAAFPPLSLVGSAVSDVAIRGPMTPSSPQSFAQTHTAAYQSFLTRKNDKSAVVRTTWTTGIGRILATSAGGIGLSPQEEHDLVCHLTGMLLDNDEKVRIAAIQAVGSFSFQDVVARLGALGDILDSKSFFHNLADRVKDRKHGVRLEAITLLGKLWGVAVGEIATGNEQVKSLLGQIPSKIFEAIYVNEVDVKCLVDGVLFDSLLPLGYPPMRDKQKHASNGTVKQHKNGFTSDHGETSEEDADFIRTRRMLLMVRDLDQRAKPVALSLLERPIMLLPYMNAFLSHCEAYNGGVMETNQKDIKQRLGKLIEFFAKTLTDSARAEEDLWRFAKLHDRRTYSLIRFCMSPESDYRKIHKSIKELQRRLEGLPGISPSFTDNMSLLVKRVSNLFYNRSHVSAIIQYSQTNEHGLGEAARELLKEVSEKYPVVFKAHADELCRKLEAAAPTQLRPNDVAALGSLKACSSFARRFPKDIPKDRKFLQSMVQYAIHGSPPASAKYAVSIIISSTDKKEMYAKELFRRCVDEFTYGSDGYLAKLACLSQLMLLASGELEDDIDTVTDIAIDQVLLRQQQGTVDEEADWNDYLDDDCAAKVWALKILVNRLRYHDSAESIEEVAKPVYQLLNTLLETGGELSRKTSSIKSHRSRLKLTAAILHLKLCSKSGFDDLLTPIAFNTLAIVAQDSVYEVRQIFVTKVEKYLSQERLPSRFYTVPFLLAFEPVRRLKDETATWARARAIALAKAKKRTIEACFARLLSLLAHHPDFALDTAGLVEFAEYIMFYLKSVASEDNLSLIYHIAQRVKSVGDAIDPDTSERLYYLSDLSQALIRHYEELHNWSMQIYPEKISLPPSLFEALPNHETAQEIAMKQYLRAEVLDQLQGVVKSSLRAKKRKSDSDLEHPSKRRTTIAVKSDTSKHKPLAVRKIKKWAKASSSKRDSDIESIPSSARRRSGRVAGAKSYAETADSEDDAEMEQWSHESKSEAQEARTPKQADTKVMSESGATNGNDGKNRKATEKPNAKRNIQLSPATSDAEISSAPESDEDA